MKITIYELLGLIKDGKAPKKIKYEGFEFYLYDETAYLKTDKTRFLDTIRFDMLNDEVEIIDIEYLNNDLGKKLLEPFYKDNKIEKLNENRYIGTDISIEKDMFDKINELIDEVNKLKK